MVACARGSHNAHIAWHSNCTCAAKARSSARARRRACVCVGVGAGRGWGWGRQQGGRNTYAFAEASAADLARISSSMGSSGSGSFSSKYFILGSVAGKDTSAARGDPTSYVRNIKSTADANAGAWCLGPQPGKNDCCLSLPLLKRDRDGRDDPGVSSPARPSPTRLCPRRFFQTLMAPRTESVAGCPSPAVSGPSAGAPDRASSSGPPPASDRSALAARACLRAFLPLPVTAPAPADKKEASPMRKHKGKRSASRRNFQGIPAPQLAPKGEQVAPLQSLHPHTASSTASTSTSADKTAGNSSSDHTNVGHRLVRGDTEGFAGLGSALTLAGRA
jgi:hypothetical protein